MHVHVSVVSTCMSEAVLEAMLPLCPFIHFTSSLFSLIHSHSFPLIHTQCIVVVVSILLIPVSVRVCIDIAHLSQSDLPLSVSGPGVCVSSSPVPPSTTVLIHSFNTACNGSIDESNPISTLHHPQPTSYDCTTVMQSMSSPSSMSPPTPLTSASTVSEIHSTQNGPTAASTAFSISTKSISSLPSDSSHTKCQNPLSPS